jgi:tetratricopeptide (TPR) repeat protein
MSLRGQAGAAVVASLVLTTSATAAQAPPSGPHAATTQGSYEATILEATKRLGADDAAGGLALATRAVQQAPRAPSGYIAKGMALFMLGRATEAGREFNHGLRLTTDGAERRAYVETIDTTTQVFKTPEEANTFSRAMASLKNRRFEEAEQLLTAALKLNPNNPRTWAELGFVQVELGHLEAAVKSLESGRQINPASRALLRELHHCYHELRRFRSLREVIADEIMVGGNEKALLQDMAVSYAAEHDTKQAIQVLERITHKYPNYAPPYYTLGQVYDDLLKDRRRAKEYFQLFLSKAAAGGDAMEGVAGSEAKKLVENAKAIVK